MTHSSFPGLLGEICDIAGPEAAIAIALERGGTRVDIPAHVNEEHWLSKCVGIKNAQRICDELSTSTLSGKDRGVRHEIIALGPTSILGQARKKLYQALEQGHSPREAALIAGVHERTAFRARAKLKLKRKKDQVDLL